MKFGNPKTLLPLLIAYFPEVDLFEKIHGSMENNPVHITCENNDIQDKWACFQGHRLHIVQKQGDTINTKESCAVNFGDLHMRVEVYSRGDLLFRKQFTDEQEYMMIRNNLFFNHR